MEIRTLNPGDEERLRAIRLASLGDSPDAFASTLEAELAYPAEHWSNLVESDKDAVFVAHDDEDDRWLGIAGVGIDWDDATGSFIWGMWVEPKARGLGAGARLLDRTLEWAKDRPTRRVRLWVTDTNDVARRLYESRGFRPSRETKPHPPDPRLTEIEMYLEFED